MYCINCGEQLPEGAKFCSFCGTKQPELKSKQVLSDKEERMEDNSARELHNDEQKAKPTGSINSEQEENANEQGSVAEELSKDNSTKSTKDSVLSVVTKGVMDVGPLMKTNRVVEQKVSLGYPNRDDNFVYTATPIEWKDMLTVTGITGLASQNYIMSFEDNGVLLMGCIGLAKFNDDNHFIKSEDIDDMQLEKYTLGDWDHMYWTVKGEEVELLVQHPTFSIIPWHRKNFNNVLMYTM